METLSTRSVRIPERYKRFEAEIRTRERHIDIVVVSWVVMGIFTFLYGIGLASLVVVGAGSMEVDDPALRIFMPALAISLLLSCIGVSVWYLLTAWGLHRRRRSARISSYVLAGLLAATVCLLPLSLYAFWVLVGSTADMAFGSFHPAVPGTDARLQGAARAPEEPRTRRETGPRAVEVVPPETGQLRPGPSTYPRPQVALRTPPAGIPRYVRDEKAPEPLAGQDYSSMQTIKEMGAPVVGKKGPKG